MRDTACRTLDPVCLTWLLDARPTRSLDTLRIALVMLAAGGHLAVDATPGGESFLRVLRAPPPGTPEHIVVVYRLLRDSARAGRLSRSSARNALTRAFGSGFRRYGKSVVSEALVKRGMLRTEKARLLWVFTWRRFRRTPTGDSAVARTTQRIADLEGLPGLLDSHPAKARKLARDAGPLLLLVPAARAAIARLRAIAPAAAHGDAFSLVEEPEAEWLELFDHAELMMSIDFDGLLEAMEAIAGLGSDTGSTSADGDGGGGDGGGGGD